MVYNFNFRGLKEGPKDYVHHEHPFQQQPLYVPRFIFKFEVKILKPTRVPVV